MDIRFVSSLTPEDEDRMAPALVQALGAILDQFPIAYTLRIETSGARVFQHSHAGAALDDEIDEPRPAFAGVAQMLRARVATS
ncbi:MAG: hypothetical protein JNM38_05460 [Acidobacteria bacterium]|nr:hypothetical protein [Acidobacteriota bacterium]